MICETAVVQCHRAREGLRALAGFYAGLHEGKPITDLLVEEIGADASRRIRRAYQGPLALDAAAEHDEVHGLRLVLLVSPPVRACRVCGCTDEDCSGCVERTGEPCRWVEADLCSACG